MSILWKVSHHKADIILANLYYKLLGTIAFQQLLTRINNLYSIT